MYVEFRHLDGACAGETRIVRKDFATIGRHPSADVPFDADRDLDVSGRHAAVFRQGDVWVLRDLGSTNGTWVNGVRLKGDRVLAPNDVLRFGAGGPQLVFLPQTGAPPTIPATHAIISQPTAPRRIPVDSTTGRIRLEVRRQLAGWKRVTIVVGVVAVVGVLALIQTNSNRRRADAEERELLLARADSLLARMDATTTSVTSLTAALNDAHRETARLRAILAAPEAAGTATDSISQALATSLDRHEAVTRAAELDLDAIALANSDAVALVVTEFVGGRRVAGTGFSVRVRGDTGWIATSRHLVIDSVGRPAAKLGVLFNGTSQNFRADLVGTADSADLALLVVRVRRGVPVVRTLGKGAYRGEPVAMLGFPFGFDFPVGGDWRRVGVRVSRFTGTVRAVGRDRLEIDGYGVSGSSGSPVFNAAGEVTGIVFGGDPASGGRTVYAVPVQVLEELLRKH
jgi:pSer/pThr/pTyr-binding forkhead associated (FHA) protein